MKSVQRNVIGYGKTPTNTLNGTSKLPILNERSCFTSTCHAHSENDEILGSLIIKLPLNELDSFVDKSSTDFMLLATIITSFPPVSILVWIF